MNRRERRLQNEDVQKRKAEKLGGLLGDVTGTGGYINPSGGQGAGGYGLPQKGSKPATGQNPGVNPFVIPKTTGLNITSQTFLPNYYVDWTLSTWRYACNQAVMTGQTISIATLYNWVFECSPFVQSLFNSFKVALNKIPFYYNDLKGNKLEDWTAELCDKPWQRELREEILFSMFWGFTGLNFDPFSERVYKYPMQEIDPINRMLRSSTYAFYDGFNFSDHANMLFIQPSASYERFLGMMQPIARAFIQMNVNNNNWIGAGARLAFPFLTIGYPQDDSADDIDPETGLPTKINPFRMQAEEVGANIDPTKAIVYSYTTNEKGEPVKSLLVEAEGKGASNRAHAIFLDFNDSMKNEIREMVFGGTLTADVGKSGSRALGEVQERKFDSVVENNIEFVLAYMNSEYKRKLQVLYKNMPDGKFDINRSKQMPLEDIVKMSNVVTQNGYRLTSDFFEANGLVKDFLEDMPMPDAGKPDMDTDNFAAAIPKRTMFGSKKKF